MNALATRRGLLRIITAAPIAVTACVAGTPVYPKSTAFAAKLARYRQLEAAHDAACDAYSEAEGAFLACHPIRPPSVGRVGDTAESFNQRVASEKAAYEAEVAAARARHHVDDYQARAAEACSAAVRAADEMMRTPAPNAAAVAAKLEIAIERGLGADELGPLLSDLRRLAGRAA